MQIILFCRSFALQDIREASTAKGSAIYCFSLGKLRFGRVRRVQDVMNERKQHGYLHVRGERTRHSPGKRNLMGNYVEIHKLNAKSSIQRWK